MDISIADIIKTLIHASILSTVFALGLKATIEDIAYLTQRPWLLLRSIIAMYLVTPLIAVLLVFAFDAPVPVEIAVLLMAISAGAPAMPKKLLVLGTNPLYVYSLAVIMAVLAMVTVPASLFLLSAVFPQDATLAPVEVATTIGTKFLAPLVVGMVARRFLPSIAQRLYEPMISIAGIVLLVVVALVVATHFSAIIGIGWTAFALIVLVVAASLGVGHFLGGPDPSDKTGLAVACASRFPGLGLLVASLNFPNAKPLPIVIAYLLTANIVSIPYVRWAKAQARMQNPEFDKDSV